MRLKPVALLVAAICMAPARASTALDLSALLSDYRVTSWAGGDGIALGEVRSIAQDQDGYLWLASDAGLVRFDGIRFARADLVAGDTPLPAAATRAVYVGRDGSLWVGYGERHGLYRIQHGEVREVHLKGQLPGLVNVITEDRDGALWVGHNDGLQRLRAGQWEAIELPGLEPGRRVLDVHQSRDGVMRVATANGLFWRRSGERFEKAPYGDSTAMGISEDAAGRVWVTDERTGFRRADAPERNALFEARGMNVFHDSRGNLWVTTIGQGLWHVRHGAGGEPVVRRATAQTGLVSDENSQVFEDRDGNIWIASLQGLNRLTPHLGTSLVDIGVVRALTLGANGTAWAGTTTGLVELTGVTPRAHGTSRLVSPASVRALHTDRAGLVWAATDDGLARVVEGRLVPTFPAGPPMHRVRSISSDSRGNLWITDVVNGLMRLANGRLEAVAAAITDTGARPMFTHVDHAERVWIAFSDGVVRRLDLDGTVAQFGRPEGLSHTTVHAIHHDRAGDIWIGGSAGLSLLRGTRLDTVALLDEGPFRTIAAVTDDDAGDLWVGVAFVGFLRVTRDDLIRAVQDPSYRLRYRLYDTGTGYPDQRLPSSGTVRNRADDALWFVTSRGITVLDTRELRQKPTGTPQPPRIEGVTADNRRYRAGADVTLPPRTSRLRIDYTVVSLSALERIRFRYRLDGFDETWVDGSGPRQAYYTNLPPGRYRFRVQASTNAAAWNEAETDWAFAIQPMFYQTRWFYSVCAIALVLGAMGAWRLRVRHVRKEVAAVFGERLRLSREIHDTVLQSLVGIALQLDAASHGADGPPSRTRAQLVAMRRQVEDYIREVRQSIWDLRSPALDSQGLVGALRASAERLTEGRTRFALTVIGTPRRCPSRIETHALRIGHEAVMNAVRHADAREVQMEIAFADDMLRLRVADDGRGFARSGAVPADQHYGLVSMTERAADAGGRCTIESTPGSGVQVVAEFPLRPTG